MAVRLRHGSVAPRAVVRPFHAAGAHVCAIGAVALAGALSAGRDHVWSVGHRWLSGGGFETVASLATLVMAACCVGTAFVSRYAGPLDNAAFRDVLRHRHGAMPDLSRPGADPGKPLTAREYLATNGIADVEQVESFLAAGLGRETAVDHGWRSLPSHLQCLAACLTVDDHDAERFAVEVGAAWERTEGRGRELDRLIAPVLDARWLEVRAVLSRHGRAGTGMLGLCERARGRSTLVTARLHWLRRHDPDLWQAACDLGRPSCHPASLALLTHHGDEVEAGGPLRPDTSAAARALLDAAGLPG